MYSTISNSKIRDIEAAVNVFFSSLATNMGTSGYSKADWLKNNMAIDTSKEPLDELKEFED